MTSGAAPVPAPEPLSDASSPALEVDAAGFPVAFADVALSRPDRPCPVVFLASGESESAPDADWAALASLVSGGATVRMRLSVRALPLALAHLEQAGTGPGVPTALVYRLKSPFFQTAHTGLHEAAQLVRRLRPTSPVDVLVGRFVAPVKPAPGRELVGRTVAVACEAGAPCRLADLLRESGARVFEQAVADGGGGDAAEGGAFAGDAAGSAPAGAARPANPANPVNPARPAAPLSCDTLAAGLGDGAIDVVVLPDAQLAGAFFRLLGTRAQSLLASTRIVACGPIAASVVEQHGLAPALQTDSYVPSRVADAVRTLDFTLSRG